MKNVLRTINPATGAELSQVEITTLSEVDAVVRSAREAFQEWRNLSFAERGHFLQLAADVLDRDAERIALVITSEMGRVLSESIPEVTKSASFFRYFAENAELALAPKQIDMTGLTLPEKESWIQYEPRGVVAVVKPWNAPVQQVVWAIAPALMAGCTVVVKPSEYTPQSGLELQRVFDEVGLPVGVFSVIPGDDRTGDALIRADVDVVAFTGSASTGREVAAVAGRDLKKTILELSGKDCLIVDRDMPDLELVASGIVYGAFSNCGHWCSSIERVFLPAELYDAVLNRVIELTRKLRVGSGERGQFDIGPIANSRQLDIVQELCADAVHHGARLLLGGKRIVGDGYFFEPTILEDVPSEARLMYENAFGPIMAVERYHTLEEAVAKANDSAYGLGLSVWTSSRATATAVIDSSETGMVWVNEPLLSVAACPWSVCKSSGIGSELGDSGIREFTFEKVVNAQFTGNSGPRAWYFPY